MSLLLGLPKKRQIISVRMGAKKISLNGVETLRKNMAEMANLRFAK